MSISSGPLDLKTEPCVLLAIVFKNYLKYLHIEDQKVYQK